MKRNKPLTKHRKPGTQRQHRKAFRFDDRGSAHWAIATPQAFAGVRESVFDMAGTVPAGDRANPQNPQCGSWLRWRIERDGKSAFVYAVHLGHGRYSSESPDAYDRRVAALFRTALPTSPDVYHVFTAERNGCTRGAKCPLASHFYSDSDIAIPRHRPDRCPASVVANSSPWRLVGRVVPDGQLIY
ncbi:hypothetical protein ACFXKW_26545 [Streptomyces sp. NPDC059193]|uniref:hypothetical protein n=1 Tax=Streptomyces sp. NPDC059193 TaxID=3346763 RepID=UPI0036CF8FC9